MSIVKVFATKDTQIRITCSFGYAVYPDDAFNFAKLFELADKGLYEAKNTGRNQGKKRKE